MAVYELSDQIKFQGDNGQVGPFDVREVVDSSANLEPKDIYVGMFFYDKTAKHVFVVSDINSDKTIKTANRVCESDDFISSDADSLKTRIKAIYEKMKNESTYSLGRINSDNTIEISDDLAPGEYEMKYEDQNGNVVEGWQSVGEFSKF